MHQLREHQIIAELPGVRRKTTLVKGNSTLPLSVQEILGKMKITEDVGNITIGEKAKIDLIYIYPISLSTNN